MTRLLVTMQLREQGRLDQLGGIPYLIELQNGVPSAENLDYYIPELRDAYDRRLVIQAVGRLKMLAEDHKLNSAIVLADTASLLERLRQYTGRNALPPIVAAPEFLAADIKRARFFQFLRGLEQSKNVLKSVIDGRWEKTDLKSKNPNHENDQ